MKAAYLLILASISAAAQGRGNVITCEAADVEHCRAKVIDGRPVRELVHQGTLVAVGKPTATADGYYRVFVSVSQVGSGKAKVMPNHFFGIYSDATHTRFGFYDKAAEVNQLIQEANRAQQAAGGGELNSPRRHGSSGPGQSIGTSKAAKLGRLRKPDPNEVAGREDQSAGSRGSAQKAGTIITPEQLYLTETTLRQGDSAEGFVYLKKPRRSKVHVGQGDLPLEIDIPVNGVVFKFN